MSTSRPDPELLPDGDILAPERLRDGTYRMIRLAPEHPDHAGWLGEIQARPKPQRQSGAPVGGIIVGLLLPVVGVVWAIVLFAQGRGAHGGAVLLSSLFGWVIAAALFL